MNKKLSRKAFWTKKLLEPKKIFKKKSLNASKIQFSMIKNAKIIKILSFWRKIAIKNFQIYTWRPPKGFSFHLPLYVPSLLSIHSFYCHKKDSLNTNDLNKKSNEYYIIKLNSNAMTKKNFFFPKMAFKSWIKINFYNFFFTWFKNNLKAFFSFLFFSSI